MCNPSNTIELSTLLNIKYFYEFNFDVKSGVRKMSKHSNSE